MAWQQNAAGVYYNLETGEISPAGSPPPGFVGPQIADIQNALADGGIWNSPDGRYSIIGGGDANTPGLPSAFAGAPRILISGGGSADGVVPPEIAAAFSMAPQGEQQRFAQQKATYEAGEGKAPTFGDAALAAAGSYFGGQALGGMLGGGQALGGATYLGGDAMSASGIGAGGITGAEMAGAGGAYPYGMGPQGTGIGTGNPYMFAGDVPPGSLNTGTVNNLGTSLDISGGLDAPGGFYSTPVEIQPGFDPSNIAGQATYGDSMSSALRNPFGLGAAGTGLAAQLSGTAGDAVGAGAASGIIPQLMAATGLSEKQLMGLGAAGISSLTSLYGASQIGKAATTAANIGTGAADRASQLQQSQYDQTRADLAPYRTAGTNALARLTAGTAPDGEFTKSFGMSDFQQDPGYGFRMSEGLKALDRTAAARGGLLSGATLKGAQRYGQDLGSQEYQNAFNRYQTNRNNVLNPLQSLAGIGQTSTNQGITAGNNYATNVGNLGMSAAGDQANAGLAAAQANRSAYGTIGNAFSNYLAPNPMNTFFQNQLNRQAAGVIMANINFGLLDTQYPEKLANAFVRSPEQQNANMLQAMQMQQLMDQREQAQYALGKSRREDTGMTEFGNAIKALGPDPDPLAIAQVFIKHPNPEYQLKGFELQREAQADKGYRDLGPMGGAAVARPAAAPASAFTANMMANRAALPTLGGNQLAATVAAPEAQAATRENLIAQIETRLRAIGPFVGRSRQAKAESDRLDKQLENLRKAQNVGAGGTLITAGLPDFIAPAAPSEFEKLLKDSGLSQEEQMAARVAKVGKDSTTISEFSNVLAQLGKTKDPFERQQLQNRLTYLSTHQPGTSLTVKLPPVEGKYSETFAKNVAEEDIKLLDAARNAPKVMATANRVLELLDKPDIFVGPAATVKLNLARALKVLGATETEKISNTEKLIAATGQGTLDAIKGANLGTGQGFTAKDLEFLTAVAGGKIDFTPENLRKMARLQQLAAELSVKKWTTRRSNMPGSALKGTGIDKETYELEPRFSPYVETKPLPDGRMLGKKRDGSVEVIK